MSTATCHTDGCASAGVPATVDAALLGAEVFCGSCGEQIADITEPTA